MRWYDTTRQDMRLRVKQSDGTGAGMAVLGIAFLACICIILFEVLFCKIHGVINL